MRGNHDSALRDDLYAWLASQHAWQQDLAKRLAVRTQLDGAGYDEALRVVKAAFRALGEGETAPDPQELALDDLPAHDTSGGAARLVGFGRLRGVGAVSHEHELRFALTPRYAWSRSAFPERERRGACGEAAVVASARARRERRGGHRAARALPRPIRSQVGAPSPRSGTLRAALARHRSSSARATSDSTLSASPSVASPAVTVAPGRSSCNAR
jgi:hypothetical protein